MRKANYKITKLQPEAVIQQCLSEEDYNLKCIITPNASRYLPRESAIQQSSPIVRLLGSSASAIAKANFSMTGNLNSQTDSHQKTSRDSESVNNSRQSTVKQELGISSSPDYGEAIEKKEPFFSEFSQLTEVEPKGNQQVYNITQNVTASLKSQERREEPESFARLQLSSSLNYISNDHLHKLTTFQAEKPRINQLTQLNSINCLLPTKMQESNPFLPYQGGQPINKPIVDRTQEHSSRPSQPPFIKVSLAEREQLKQTRIDYQIQPRLCELLNQQGKGIKRKGKVQQLSIDLSKTQIEFKIIRPDFKVSNTKEEMDSLLLLSPLENPNLSSMPSRIIQPENSLLQRLQRYQNLENLITKIIPSESQRVFQKLDSRQPAQPTPTSRETILFKSESHSLLRALPREVIDWSRENSPKLQIQPNPFQQQTDFNNLKSSPTSSLYGNFSQLEQVLDLPNNRLRDQVCEPVQSFSCQQSIRNSP